MKVLPAILMLSAMTFAEAAPCSEQLLPICADAQTDMQQQLNDVIVVNNALCQFYDEETVSPEMIQKVTAEIRPACARLAQLSPEKLKELCLLADGIVWQKNWIYSVYLGENGVLMEAPFEYGFELLSLVAEDVKARLASDTASTAEKEAWKDLLSVLGGEAVLQIPQQWIHDRLATDYKTALTFFKELYAAALVQDEAQSLKQIQEQEAVLAYLTQGGEADCIRLNYLAAAFVNAVTKLNAKAEPQTISLARKIALQRFCEKLPNLKGLFN